MKPRRKKSRALSTNRPTITMIDSGTVMSVRVFTFKAVNGRILTSIWTGLEGSWVNLTSYSSLSD
jgi:hypothetical protein